MSTKIGRNDPCHCRSGKKWKKCHGSPNRPTPPAEKGYRNNHYVPIWYQKRFIPAEQKDKELYYLDLHPTYLVNAEGVATPLRELKRQGPRFCFFEEDLYTMRLGNVESRDIEKVFFGDIDDRGRDAVEYFENFKHPSMNGKAYQDFLEYLTIQKLRTPKGFRWLLGQSPIRDRNLLLLGLQQLVGLYGAVWTECIWQIADASQSATKFIVSDHPVTIYNRECVPDSAFCSREGDPDIRLQGSHTIFPLSLEKILILTNLSWVRNPYQSPRATRPNPSLKRPSMFKFTTVQTLRHLSEREVTEVNLIIKRRAYRYIGAAREEWLYPERSFPQPHWRQLGNGYLLMPDPRSVQFSGEIIIGHNDGTSSAIDEYGFLPGQQGFGDRERSDREWETFQLFKGDFAAQFGPHRRGRSFEMMHLGPDRDSDDMHEAHLKYAEEIRKRREDKNAPQPRT